MTRRVRLTVLIVGSFAALAILLLLGLYLAARHEPTFYREALHIDRVVLEKGSDRMLQQTTALASAVKKPGHWESLFTAEQINGWLAVDLVRNHPHTLPPELHDPRVAIDPKRITVACCFDHDGLHSVLSLTIEPYVPEPNILALRIVSARAGLLPVPLGQVLDRITEGTGTWVCIFSGGVPTAIRWPCSRSPPPTIDRCASRRCGWVKGKSTWVERPQPTSRRVHMVGLRCACPILRFPADCARLIAGLLDEPEEPFLQIVGKTIEGYGSLKLFAGQEEHPLRCRLLLDGVLPLVPTRHRAAFAGDGPFVIEVGQAMIGQGAASISRPGRGGWASAHVFSTSPASSMRSKWVACEVS